MTVNLPEVSGILHDFELVAIRIMEPLLSCTGWSFGHWGIWRNALFLHRF